MAQQTTPLALPIGEAMEQSAALVLLTRRLQESNARYAAVQECLPAPLRTHVTPGPIDDEGWSLLAANAAVAAKLRHLLPRLDDALRAKGWQPTAIRVRIQSG
jgi:hypothetical protein